MTSIQRLCFALIAVLSMSTAAIAQDQPAADSSQRVKELNFAEGDEILGELASANYLDVSALGEAKLPTLIRVRSNFDDLMLKDVEGLP